MVNGEVWIPYYQCGLINFPTKCEELQSVVIPFDTTSNLPLEADFFASRKIGEGSFIYTRDSIGYYPQYPLSNASNAITLTKLDTVNQIISGTFYFTLYNQNNPAFDSVVISDGRFDVTYNACLCH